ncbi:hypothetical protein LO749_09485 [Paracoccus denitrificans]|uniref:hypothetical protein n=1 Tax=Paracoccus denitrificans TaxID=266 RepID=UPI001E331559|nr:hypothetical protein [Paracoccus denitrificans]UFS64400.1 hypothetical protein LO749_09485 [Paracoccus denitrificans]
MVVFPVEIGRVNAVDEDYLSVPERLHVTLQANYSAPGVPEQSGTLTATTLIPGAFSERPLRHLEQIADEALADVLEAIAAELRKRARQ